MGSKANGVGGKADSVPAGIMMPSCRVTLRWIKWFCKGHYRKRSAVRTGRRRRSRKKFKGKLVLYGFIGIRQRTE